MPERHGDRVISTGNETVDLDELRHAMGHVGPRTTRRAARDTWLTVQSAP